jgi:hypothetical protein
MSKSVTGGKEPREEGDQRCVEQKAEHWIGKRGMGDCRDRGYPCSQPQSISTEQPCKYTADEALQKHVDAIRGRRGNEREQPSAQDKRRIGTTKEGQPIDPAANWTNGALIAC